MSSDQEALSDRPPPSRPGAATYRPRKWLPVLAVAAVLFVVVAGGSIALAALSTERGAPVGVAGAVSVRPLSGWRVAGRATVHGVPDLRLTRGNGNLDVLAAPFDAGAARLVRVYLHEIVAPQAKQLQVSSSLDVVHLDGGLIGARGFYIGLFGDRAAPIEGEVTGVVVGGRAILFDGWAPSGEYQYVQGDVHAMTQAARFQ